LSIYKNKGEEPTAKDSMIQDQKLRFDQLLQLYKDLASEYRELLRENTNHKFKISELEGKVEALDNIFQKWKQSNEDIKKNLNPNLIYDGIQEYKS
jgi:predicted RNase H-like nuclease (RuvC/YqgF family)|tara:strand:+ start:4049 stop:4336 length:288 start_codon:yes stop_codon:yes gene_type:complete